MAASTQSIWRLSSGIDTATIIDQLMQIERAPQVRLQNQVSVSAARKTVLSDVQTRLKNLQLAAQDLKSSTLWSDKQTVDINDPTKATVTPNGPSGTGSYSLTATALARGRRSGTLQPVRGRTARSPIRTVTRPRSRRTRHR